MGRILKRVDGLIGDEGGFSTVGVALALLLTISLVFTAAQVYELDSASADVQDVADAAALASENVVAEFYLVADVCDAVVLSLSLCSVACLGLGVATVCIPFTAAFSETFFKASRGFKSARDDVSRTASEGLDRIQRLLPYLSIAKAAQVCSSNSLSDEARYVGVVVLSPMQSDELENNSFPKADDALDEFGDRRDELMESSKEAEEAAREANEWKQRAFEADSGSKSGYCMYQRALTLAGMKGGSNPFFSSVETWSFDVPLKRTKTYYKKRLKIEKPQDSSVAEEARSALRKRVFRYARSKMKEGFVHETETSFSANFPLLPRNTSEMRQTELYTESRYPITSDDKGAKTMHAWSGCPVSKSAASVGKGSISQMESGSFETCPKCGFKASSMGKVLSASTNIDNGFEHYYRIVASAAKEYGKAKSRFAPEKEKAESLAGSLFAKVGEALKEASGKRIEVKPPGRKGVVAIVADLSKRTSSSFSSSFVESSGSLGPRVALSSACLLKEESEEGKTLISGFLDGLSERGGVSVGPMNLSLELWSGLLSGYSEGQDAFVACMRGAVDSIPFASESGLGEWAETKLTELIASAGLEKPELRAAKAVLVNTGDVLPGMDTAFSARLLSLKGMAQGSEDGTLFSGALSQVEHSALESVSSFGEEIELGSIRIFDGVVEIPLVISFPSFAKDYLGGLVSSFFDGISGLASSLSGERRWE